MKKIKILKQYAIANRIRDVRGEKVFRFLLKKNGIDYQRQKVIFKYIVDFYFPKRNLIVEVDGKYHKHGGVKRYDQKRQSELESYGFCVVRFTDEDVLSREYLCIEKVLSFPEARNIEKACKYKLAFLNTQLFKNIERIVKFSKKPLKPKIPQIQHPPRIRHCFHGRPRKWCCKCRYG